MGRNVASLWGTSLLATIIPAKALVMMQPLGVLTVYEELNGILVLPRGLASGRQAISSGLPPTLTLARLLFPRMEVGAKLLMVWLSRTIRSKVVFTLPSRALGITSATTLMVYNMASSHMHHHQLTFGLVLRRNCFLHCFSSV